MCMYTYSQWWLDSTLTSVSRPIEKSKKEKKKKKNSWFIIAGSQILLKELRETLLLFISSDPLFFFLSFFLSLLFSFLFLSLVIYSYLLFFFLSLLFPPRFYSSDYSYSSGLHYTHSTSGSWPSLPQTHRIRSVEAESVISIYLEYQICSSVWPNRTLLKTPSSIFRKLTDIISTPHYYTAPPYSSVLHTSVLYTPYSTIPTCAIKPSPYTNGASVKKVPVMPLVPATQARTAPASASKPSGCIASATGMPPRAGRRRRKSGNWSRNPWRNAPAWARSLSFRNVSSDFDRVALFKKLSFLSLSWTWTFPFLSPFLFSCLVVVFIFDTHPLLRIFRFVLASLFENRGLGVSGDSFGYWALILLYRATGGLRPYLILRSSFCDVFLFLSRLEMSWYYLFRIFWMENQ